MKEEELEFEEQEEEQPTEILPKERRLYSISGKGRKFWEENK